MCCRRTGALERRVVRMSPEGTASLQQSLRRLLQRRTAPRSPKLVLLDGAFAIPLTTMANSKTRGKHVTVSPINSKNGAKM